MAKDYFELASQHGYYQSFYKLGTLFINNDVFNADIPKAINYFNKCIETNGEIINIEKNGFINEAYNTKYYPSHYELGQIYLLKDHENFDLAIKYLKASLYGEYPPAQNNYGIICQFYHNNKNDAKYYFQKAAKSFFVLAEYNLGNLIEEEEGIEIAIEYYVKASEHENLQFIFHNDEINDERIIMTKSFIILLTNLKLFHYYSTHEKKGDAKLYLTKIYDKIFTSNEDQLAKEIGSNICLHIKTLFTNFHYLIEKEFNFLMKYEFENENKIMNNQLIDFNKMNISNIRKRILDLKHFKIDAKNSIEFSFLLESDKNLELFNKKLYRIIESMKSILYDPPYNILFSKTPENKTEGKQNQKTKMKTVKINQSFYNGFGIEI